MSKANEATEAEEREANANCFAFVASHDDCDVCKLVCEPQNGWDLQQLLEVIVF